MEQERIPVADLEKVLSEKVNLNTLLRKIVEE